MIYSDLTKKAMKIAYKAHEGQTDKGGLPYIYHPIHIAEQMDDEKSVCTALLHDVAEDTNWSIEMLENAGFSGEIADALRLLKRDKGMDYMEYVRRIKPDKLAVKVKCADLRHNIDMTRLAIVDEKATERAKRYKKALNILQNE